MAEDKTFELDFAKGGGLIPAIIQDAGTGEVLTLFYMDEEALRRTRESRRVWRFSRSQGRIMRKGDTSGNVLHVESIAADLHFTLPFDMGIIDGRKRLTSDEDPFHGDVQEDGRVFVGAPYQVDCEASSELGVKAEHLRLVEKAKDDQRRSSNDGGEQR